MAYSVKKIREIVCQMLYSRNFEMSDDESDAELIMRQNEIPKSLLRQVKITVDSVWNIKEDLERWIQSKSKEYDLDRIARVEKAILQLGIYELTHTNLPAEVVISEAVRLCKKYSTKEGASFVNALLDAIYKEKTHGALSTK